MTIGIKSTEVQLKLTIEQNLKTKEIDTTESQINMSKLVASTSLIPVFDGESAVTAKYFLDTFNNLTDTIDTSDAEKLLILKSRIRGEALTQLINSEELSKETKWENFQKEFLRFFGTKTSLAARQQLFSNCKMNGREH